jgi:acetyl esterase/lipase
MKRREAPEFTSSFTVVSITHRSPLPQACSLIRRICIHPLTRSFPFVTLKPQAMKSFRLLAITALATIITPLCAQEPEHISDLIYTKHDGVALTMDVFKPANPNGAGIIKIVSGGWKSNHKGISDGGWPKAGYTTFVVVHGSQPRFQVEEIVTDLNRAVRFVRANAAHYGVDPMKLGVTGSSAGGHLSLMLATRGGDGNAGAADPVDRESSAVQAAACFYPPTDYLNWFEDGDNAVGIGRLEAYAGAFGPKSATPEGREALGRELSPIYWVRKNQPPVFIVHGDADPQVSITQAHRFLKRCNEAGANCELFIREGAGHGGWQEMSDDTARMTEWFDLQLLGRQPAKPFGQGVKSGPSTPVKKAAAK